MTAAALKLVAILAIGAATFVAIVSGPLPSGKAVLVTAIALVGVLLFCAGDLAQLAEEARNDRRRAAWLRFEARAARDIDPTLAAELHARADELDPRP